MDALSIAEWKKSNPHGFIAMSITLPDRTVLLTSGGQVTFGGNTYTAEDSTFGFLSQVGAFEDGDVTTASAPELTFESPTDAGITDAVAADIQGSAWVLYWGVVDPATGDVVGTPVELTAGNLNVGSMAIAEGRRTLRFTSYTPEQFQLIRRGVLLAEDPILKPLMARLGRKIYWRSEPPRGQTSRGLTTGGNRIANDAVSRLF